LQFAAEGQIPDVNFADVSRAIEIAITNILLITIKAHAADLPNDFDNSRQVKSEAYAAEESAIKDERPRWKR
jgi:hypothetical protein